MIIQNGNSNRTRRSKVSVHNKLMQARIALQAKQLKKSGHNKFAGYEYFELGDFLPTVQSICADIGICGTVSFYPDKAELTITDITDNTSIVFPCPMATAMLKGCHDVQNLGASMTYIRRYLWVNALEIVEHDALDAITGKDDKKPSQSVPKDKWDEMSEAKKRELQGIADEVREMINIGNMHISLEILSKITDVDEKTALWSRLDAKERSAIKKASCNKL